jgi:hypothetical protein
MAKTGEEVDDHGWHHRTVAKSSGVILSMLRATASRACATRSLATEKRGFPTFL